MPEGGAVAEILEEIRSVTEGFHWHIHLEFALGLLEMSREEFYQRMYRQKKKISEVKEGFGPDNVQDLIWLFEEKGLRDAGMEFYRAGYYLNQDQLIDWLDFFLSVTMSKMQSTPVDREILETAVHGSRNFHDAVEFYGSSVFEIEELIQSAVSIYIKRSGIEDSPMSRHILGSYIQDQMRKRVIRWEDLCLALAEDLKNKAQKWGILERIAAMRQKFSALSEEEVRALKSLGFLDKRMPDLEELKTRYRDLLKKYHPDINPDGLEITRQLNLSYHFLLDRLYV